MSDMNELARLVVCAAKAAYTASLTGRSPDAQSLSRWMRARPPEMGSVVYEDSAGANAEHSGRWLDHVGYYRGTETTTVPASADGECGAYERTWHVIETFDGRRQRWDNCEFIRVPDSWGLIYRLGSEAPRASK